MINNKLKIVSGIIVTLLVVVGSVLFFKSKKTLNSERIIRRCATANIVSLDIQEVHDRYNEEMARHIYEPLLNYHHTTEGVVLAPLLIEKLPRVSKDKLVYTFNIKKGVHFHDNPCFTKTQGKGREITAYDVEFSFIRIFDPEHSCAYMTFIEQIKGALKFRKAREKNASTPYAIEGIKVLDKYTLQITLEKPNPEFLYCLAMNFTSVLSKEATEYYKENFRFNPVGTGPWILTNPLDLRATKLILKANKNYHACFPKIVSSKYNYMKKYVGKKLPLMDELHIEIIKDANAAWLKFNNGELDEVSVPDVETYKSSLDVDAYGNKTLKKELKEKGMAIQPEVNTGIGFIYINCNIKQLQEVKVRRAVALAIDLDRIIRLTADGYAKLAQGVLIPGFEDQGYDPSYRAPYTSKLDIQQAKKLLAEAGYPKGKGLDTFNFYVTNSAFNKKLMPCLKEDLAKIGIKIKVVYMAWADLNTKVKDKDSTAWAFTCAAWGLDIPDMINFFQLFYSKNAGSNNTSCYRSKAFDALFEKASSMEPGDERTKLYKKMNQMVAEQVPAIPLFIRERYEFINKKLKNRKPRINFVHDSYKYMDKEKSQ